MCRSAGSGRQGDLVGKPDDSCLVVTALRFFENLEEANIDDILSWYDGLVREQVKAVIEFAARSLDTPVASC